MKVLIAYCYGLPHVGGLWTYVHELRQALEKKGHSVSILAADSRTQTYYLLGTDQSVRIRSFSGVVKSIVDQYFQNHRPKLDSWLINREIFRYSFELAAAYFGLAHYDVIHTQDAESTQAISRVKPPATPLISTFHCSHTRETFVAQTRAPGTLRWNYVAMEEALAVAAADSLIVPSHWLKTILQGDYHPEKDHIQVIPHGIDTSILRKRMREPSPIERKDGLTHIVCVARLVPEKGHRHLLKALAHLNKKRQDWVCWLVGDGYLRKSLIQLRDRLQLQEQVIFAGAQENVPSILAKADIFVLPSMLETLGYAVMEAQLAGKPVVVTDAGGLSEVVSHRETGLVVPAGQSKPLFHNLQLLMENRSLASRIATKAKRWALRQWTIDNMLSRTLRIYRKTIGSESERERGIEQRVLLHGSRNAIKPFPQLFSQRYASKVEDPELWRTVLSALPDTYTIPDREMVKGLVAYAHKASVR